MAGTFAEDPSRGDGSLTENRRLRILTERALFHGDELASDELKTMIKPYIRRLVRHLNRHHIEDATQTLTVKAFRVLKEHLDEVNNLAGFLRVSLRNELLDFLRTQQRIENREQPIREGQDFQDPATISSLAHRLQDHVMQKHLDEWKAEALLDRDRTGHEVVQVIELCYYQNLKISEACATLNFSPKETKTISEKISKQRKNPNSKLFRLARLVLDVPEDEFRKDQSQQSRPATDKDQSQQGRPATDP
jgi:DNA-directed RNA polymerase specialized sigma24 family protein